MNSRDFVQALSTFFLPEQLNLAQKLLELPSKSANARQAELSRWFLSLAQDDQLHVRSLLRETIANCVFSFLVLLDNCDSISSEEETGYFELFYATASKRVRLNVISEGPSDAETYRKANEALAADGQPALLHDLFLDAQSERPN
jgi:hypothetical protein